MNRLMLSLSIGVAAAFLDVIPMIIKKLDILFILSACFMWVIVGAVNVSLKLVAHPLLNGLIVALLFFMPLSFLIFRLDRASFPQVCLSTVILGLLVGGATGFLIK